MEDLPTDSIVVFTSAFANGFKGKRPAIRKKIKWNTLHYDVQTQGAIEALSTAEQLELLVVRGTGSHLELKKERLARTNENITFTTDSVKLLRGLPSKWLPLKSADTIEVAIYYKEHLSKEQQFISAAFKVISKYLNRPIAIKTTGDSTTINLSTVHSLIWLSEEPVEKPGRSLLLFRPDSLALRLIEPGPITGVYHLTTGLDPENIIEGKLAEQLIAMLKLHPNLDKNLINYDRRVVDEKELKHKYLDIENQRSYARIIEISPWLWLVLGILLIAERVIARYRRQ